VLAGQKILILIQHYLRLLAQAFRNKKVDKMNENYNFFMGVDLSPYAGEWIAICENKIVSHGTDVKEVFKKAKNSCPGKKPLLTNVPTEETMIL